MGEHRIRSRSVILPKKQTKSKGGDGGEKKEVEARYERGGGKGGGGGGGDSHFKKKAGKMFEVDEKTKKSFKVARFEPCALILQSNNIFQAHDIHDSQNPKPQNLDPMP